jgi:hypothetical protein
MNDLAYQSLQGTGAGAPDPRKVELQAKDFTQGEEGIVLPIVYGRVRRSGIHVTPIFGFRSDPIYSQVGK